MDDSFTYQTVVALNGGRLSGEENKETWERGDILYPLIEKIRPMGEIFMEHSYDTHLKSIGYILWIFGFTGSHRFYYGKPTSGTIWFFTLGLFFIGWIIDFFLIPSMDRQADFRYRSGKLNYTVAWILLTFLGLFGIHRFYMGKWFTGIVYLFSGGIFGVGYLYDLWTLNDQVPLINSGA
jgi:TM2 domain-containing membrane protein YozV